MRLPWTARRYNQSILKEISPEYSLEGLMLKLKLQYFGHLMQRADSFENTLMLGKIEGGRRRGQQRMRWLDRIKWPKYWGFSFKTSPFNEHPGLISFRMDWLDLLAVQGTLKSLLQHHSSKASLNFLYSPTLTSIHDYWKNHIFDSTELRGQSNVSAF